MKRPKFTKKQLTWLREILTPSCCHVSGEHNPTHFKDQLKKVCYIQRYKAYDNAIKLLRFKLVGKSDSNCGWCK